jgi:hypothetical protein
MPVVAASAYSELENTPDASSFSLEAAEQRLMSRLDSVPPAREFSHHRKLPWRMSAGLVAASMAVVASLIGAHFVRSKSQPATQPIAAINNVEEASRPMTPSNTGTELRPALERSQREVAKLQAQLRAAEDRYRQANSATASTEQRLEAEQGERAKISEERDALSQQLSAAHSEAQSLREKSSASSAMAAQQTTETVALEAQLHELNSALDEKDRMLAIDKEFLDHDREIRDLIAARNLYIADIYDVAQNGKTAKPFGRIFYTKDKSLVFYGYDLDKQSGINQSVAFQAWGSGDDKQNVSLGLFYQDDSHKRWVLRFNDTKTLARLNMVFVTAEPQGGSAKPTGKPLLLAYLQMQPNHP